MTIRVGISACLVGHEVRWDGGHKHDRFLSGTLGRFLEFVPVCPEVEVGMGTPRETIRLVRANGEEVRLVGTTSNADHTVAMKRYALRRLKELERLELGGYVFKRGSPSCGMERVKVYGASKTPRRNGRGLFAAALMERYPLLPVEEEGRLADPRLRENFVVRLFAYRRLQAALSGRWRVADLVRFHGSERLLLRAHDPKGARALGELVAAPGARSRAELGAEFGRSYMRSLGKIATTAKQVKVLAHVRGYVKKLLSDDERQELDEAIEDYCQERAPLLVPVTLLRHFLRSHGVRELEDQVYLAAHPTELQLRNHV